MKKLTFLLIASALFFASCTKQTDDLLAVPEQAKIEFRIFSSLKSYSSVVASQQTIAGTKVFSFVGTKNPQAENIFSMTFTAADLKPGTYQVNTGVVSFREGNTVVTNSSASNNFFVTITSNKNGLVNGSFSGTLTDQSNNTNCTIIQGKLENIQLTYR